ncbi:MAG TPA: phospho-N-acetylmuramoyl-pentapeptide-transferase [Actinomycetota bacterium]|nr:phospho-N-acetylmuramoyl-pentapeptide-transferase [Actinomycetota bacterium]
MTPILLAAGVGLLVSLLGTPLAIRLFRAWGWGQHIRADGPRGHLEKMGTPTMGGVVIIGAMGAAYLAARWRTPFTHAGLAVLGVTLGLGVVGAVDDLIKIRNQRSLGLTKTTKLVGQALVAVGFGVVAVELSHVSQEVSFIRADTGLRLGLGFYLWVFLMVVASSNAVNLTDGLDGLASGSAALVLAAYVIISFWQARHSCLVPQPTDACYDIRVVPALDVAIVAAAALGAVTGFLWWNAAPAKIFMGDTGSLALGGLLAGLAIMTETQLLLLILGGLYVLETASVIAQVVAFRLTGRRVFRMAPLHHHFELAGWPEFTVIVRFWILAGLAVAFGLGLFYADFLARGGTA